MMPTEQTATCVLDLSAEQLSTWRALGLDPSEAAWIDAHVASCDACRAILADYDAVDRMLQSQVVPAPRVALWEELEPRLAYGPAYGSFGWRGLPLVIALRMALRSLLRDCRHSRQVGEAPPPVARPPSVTRLRALSSSRLRAITSVAALAALLLVVVGFASVLHGRGTPSPLTLAWQQGTFPAGMKISELGNFESIVPAADGNTSYTCIPSQQGGQAHVQIWVTHDRARHWVRVSELPALPANYTHCGLSVDRLRPETIIAATSTASFPPQGDASDFVTFDAGKTWQAFANPTLGSADFATWRDSTYTVSSYGVMVSRDRMRTWKATGPPMTGRIPSMGQFWVQPDSGDLLATVMDHGEDRSYVWTSNDGGQHWSQMMTPVQRYFEAQQSLVDQPWHLCGAGYTNGTPAGPGGVDCSWDGGRTWTSYPSPTPSQQFFVVALTASGDLLADGQAPNAIGVYTDALYRLSPTTGRWQSLGSPPAGDSSSPVLYAAAPGNGVLWRVVTELAYETKPVSEARDLAITAIYTADYPAG